MMSNTEHGRSPAEPKNIKKSRYFLYSLCCAAILGMATAPSAALADAISYTLYFTTFAGGQNVNKVAVSYNGDGSAGNGAFSIGSPVNIASTGGADGIVFNPNDNKLLVGGQGFAVHEVDPVSGTFTTANPNVAAFHLAVDPSKQVVWASSIPGALASLPINPSLSGPGTVLPLSGNDTAITSLAFVTTGPADGTVFYTASGSGGFGNFGTINLATGVTTRLLSSVPAAHGMNFDPYTGDLILVGDGHITQIDPANPTVLVSDLTIFGGSSWDQGAVDGKGHAFVANNSGNLLFLDYSNTSLVADPGNFTTIQFLAPFLDDVAPLIGAGGTGTGTGTVPEPGSLALLGVGLAGLVGLRRRQGIRT